LKALLVGAGACLVCLGTLGCVRSMHVTEQMTWECAPEEYNPTYYAKPDEYARFRFVENPRCFEVESSRNLCAEMRKAGKAVINVEFDLWGHSKLQGYRITSVDGRPLQNAGGWGSSGSNGESEPCPLTRAFAR
jgi:hypothetical protein